MFVKLEPGYLSHPSFSQPPPTLYWVRESRGLEEHSFPLFQQKCWLNAFPRVPRLTGCG